MKKAETLLLEIFLFLFWLFCCISAIFRTFHNDNTVFWEWAQLVHDTPMQGLDAIESIWEIKGLLSRLIFYQLYVITQWFVSDLFPIGQYVYQFFGYLEMCLLIGLAVFFVPKHLLSSKEKRRAFYIITIGIFTATPHAAMQPEEWGICMIVLSFSLLLHNSIMSKIVGGILLGLCFFVKTPFILLAGSVFFALTLFAENKTIVASIKSIWVYALSALFVIVLLLGILWSSYPIEIQDIVDASHYQTTLISLPFFVAMQSISECMHRLYIIPLQIPILTIGLMSLIVFFTEHDKRENLYMICVWLFPYLYVAISNRYFNYHFVTFLFPVFISVIFTKGYWISLSLKKIGIVIAVALFVGLAFSFHQAYFVFRILLVFIALIPYVCIVLAVNVKWRRVATLSAFFLCVFIFASWNSVFSYSAQKSRQLMRDYVFTNESRGYYQNRSIGNKPILHLTPGKSVLWMRNPSYLRHFYPLPIQRTKDSVSFSYSETYIQTKNQLLNYSGDIIVLDSAWFFNFPHDEIKRFIDDNYSLQDSLLVYTKNFELYNKQPVTFAWYQIYKKREE